MSQPFRADPLPFGLQPFVTNAAYNEPLLNKTRLYFPWAVCVTLSMQGTGYLLAVDFTHKTAANRYLTLPGDKRIGLAVVANRRRALITSPRDAVLQLRVHNDAPDFTSEYWRHVESVLLAEVALGHEYQSLLTLLKQAVEDLMPGLTGSTTEASKTYACISVTSFWEGTIGLYALAAHLGGLHFNVGHYLGQHYEWWSRAAKGRDMRRKVVGEQAPGVVRNNIDSLEFVMRNRGFPTPD